MEMDCNILPSSTAFTTPLYARQFQLRIRHPLVLRLPDPQKCYQAGLAYSQVSARQAPGLESDKATIVWSSRRAPNPIRPSAWPCTSRPRRCSTTRRWLLAAVLRLRLRALPADSGGRVPKTKAGVPQPDWNGPGTCVRTLYVKK